MLFVGDLSYADRYPFHDNTRWDTWGRFVERSTAYQPWIWTAGNHEQDFVPEIVFILYIFFSMIDLTGSNLLKYTINSIVLIHVSG